MGRPNGVSGSAGALAFDLYACEAALERRGIKSPLGEALTALGRREASGGVVPSTSQPFKVAFCLTGKSRLGFGCGHRTSWAGVSQTLHCTCELSRPAFSFQVDPAASYLLLLSLLICFLSSLHI
ncbi:hypothetical protein CH63R_13793 [Colletotrichum higginsianum IMI 349063]|uniref:Uncharacterized protein n=1 Tax=Colletotrichum higginsianum (strain IMI 349063) TaxID=759273 RepID=A0A1B7XS50_COLHI|nr:hypothetical protein CH63R_13793 [Colletotrichum higginsianum IMI 349063]OBR02567.1 hypothetical protein CH63R_13793 [Colletotrichum higginsianum IMI 349063]